MAALKDVHRVDLQQAEPIDEATQLANTGLANTGLANTGLANTGLANTGLANTGLANTGRTNPGFIVVGSTDAARGIRTPAEPLGGERDAAGKGGGDYLWHPSTLARAPDTQRAELRS
ncbi:pentapeptide repeat-containing protein [Glaciibacter superstes]|uniref:pentapeptide repeat-containing protein n=1 Tax=Glaciibacter superstes TaxID=501023 RepID=UPI003CCBA18D